jgi:hypothetical protein
MTIAVDVSPIDAAQQALQHTRRQLFPFRFERWLALGFMAFLDQCGRTQTGFSTGFPGGPSHPSGGGGHTPGEVLSQAAAWLGSHITLVVVLAAVILVIILCFTALVLWINSRGVFMYLDAVATGRADVSRPWHEHAARADSYFAWSFGLGIGALTGGIVLLVTAVLVVFRIARGPSGFDFGAGVVVALAVLAGMLLIFVLSFALASLALRDFVAPIQMRTGLSCGACIGLFLGLLRLYPGAFVVYVLLKVVLYMVVAFVVTVAACVTCCCALVPVVTQTLLQPVFYFERAWPVFLLRPLGYDLVTAAAGVPFGTKEEPPHVQVPEPR